MRSSVARSLCSWQVALSQPELGFAITNGGIPPAWISAQIQFVLVGLGPAIFCNQPPERGFCLDQPPSVVAVGLYFDQDSRPAIERPVVRALSAGDLELMLELGMIMGREASLGSRDPIQLT